MPPLEHPRVRRTLTQVAGWLLVFNLLDAILTIVGVSAGLATEANPLLANLIHASPVAFVVVKLSLVSLGTLLLWRLRTRLAAAIGLVAGVTTYAAVLVFFHAPGLPYVFAYLQR